MALELDAHQGKKFREALLDAFPSWDDLDMMFADQLGEDLERITARPNRLDRVAFDLIRWARARSASDRLIEAARRANPDNSKLFLVAQSCGLTSTQAETSALEKIIGRNSTFLDVARWRAELTRMEWRVCRIDFEGAGHGTGFLVAPDVVLTNYHVVESVHRGTHPPAALSCRFDYKMRADGEAVAAGEILGLAADWLVDFSPYSALDLQPDPKPGEPSDDELDYALLRLEREVGHEAAGGAEQAEPRGWIEISDRPVDFAAQRVVTILQHPRTQPLELALGMAENVAVNSAGNRIRHAVPTEPGSSGSPLFDGDWRLVALHHSGAPDTIHPSYNQAIPITKIAARPTVRDWLQTLPAED